MPHFLINMFFHVIYEPLCHRSFHLSFVVLLIFWFFFIHWCFFPILVYFISVCSLNSCPVQPNLVLLFIVASFSFHTSLSLCFCQSRQCCLLYCVITRVTHVKNRVAKLVLWQKYILVCSATNQLMKPTFLLDPELWAQRKVISVQWVSRFR